MIQIRNYDHIGLENISYNMKLFFIFNRYISKDIQMMEVCAMSNQEQRMMMFNGIGALKLAKVRISDLYEEMKILYGVNAVRGMEERKERLLKMQEILAGTVQALLPLKEEGFLPVAGTSLMEKSKALTMTAEKERYSVKSLSAWIDSILNHVDYIINDLERQKRNIGV